MYESGLSCSPNQTYMPTIYEENENSLPQQHTGIVYSGATHLYSASNAPHGPLDTSAAAIKLGTANKQVATSVGKATLPIPQLTADFPTTGYIMPDFTNTLIGVGPICDTNCAVVFKKKDVTVLSPEVKPILQGWREKKLPRLWRFALKPNNRSIQNYTTTNQKSTSAHSAYDLPSIEALVRYMHAAAGFPVKSTWLKAIKKVKFESWPGLAYTNAAKYCPHSVETLKGHMVQSLQGVRSTKKDKHQANNNKKKPIQGTLEKQSEAEDIPPLQKTQELHIWYQPISKLYTDYCGRLPI